jgi:hypothetical protein
VKTFLPSNSYGSFQAIRLSSNQAINLALCKANINPAYKPSEKKSITFTPTAKPSVA